MSLCVHACVFTYVCVHVSQSVLTGVRLGGGSGNMNIIPWKKKPGHPTALEIFVINKE
jgi:hypothetical protein